MTYCLLRNLAYIGFHDVCDVVQPLKAKVSVLPVMGQESERDCSTQVITAALNEEPGIGQTITELLENLHTKLVLVVDGKSRDRTVEIANNSGANIVFQDSTNKGDAISKALEYTDSDVNYVVLTDQTIPIRQSTFLK